MHRLRFLSSLVLRSPIYSFSDYNPDKLQSYLNDPYFILAIYLASPQLHQIVADANYDIQQLTKGHQLSLLKYANRMHYRPTPFGGFSAFSVTHWDESNGIRLSGLDNLKFHTGWDHEVVLKLLSAYTDENWQAELLYLNPTLYEVKNEYRYVRTHFNFDTRAVTFSLEALDSDPLIKEVLSLMTPPKTGRQLLETLCEQLNFKINEAYDYLSFLLATQLVLPASHPNTLGLDTTPSGILTHPDVDFPGLKKANIAQDNLNQFFKNKHIAATQHKFYTNTQRPVIGGLSPAYQHELLSALDILSKMQPVQLPPALKAFIEAFKARYDQEEIPLLKALDPEVGIDYDNLATNNNINELLADLDFSSAEPARDHISWSVMHKLFLRKWNNGIESFPEISLSSNEPELHEQQQNAVNLPPSIAVMFRVAGNEILLESAGGVSGCALIGRFAALDPGIKKIAEELISTEQATNPDVIFAEIGQLSGMHTDNINKRPHLYHYEIPVNTLSSLPAEKQIQLNDLYLSVKQNRLIIRSKKLGKEIIPRLTSAYNYAHNALAIFRFLCDMQHQGVQSNLSFNIESFFPGLSVYPRVKIGNVIISPAKWFLNEAEIQSIYSSDAGLKKLIRKKHWPSYIALTQNDQQLVFNLNNDAEICMFQSCIRKLKSVQVQEYFLCDEQTATNHQRKPVINQFITFLANTKASYHPLPPFTNHNPINTERDFSLGSEWMYLKIYCHEHSANNLLSDLFELLMALEVNTINKWFFIRYTDPKPHIRLRINAAPKYQGSIIKKLHDCLKSNIECNIIQGYQADIYRREIERYGPELMEEVEHVFYYSSKLVCKYLKQLNATPGTFSYYSLALVSTNHLIELFNDFIGDELTFISTIAKGLYHEFSTDKNLQISLDQKYRSMKPEIHRLLASNNLYPQLNLNKEVDLFINACIVLKERASNKNKEQKAALVADVIHMHLNRIFFEQQRKQELCIYHLLYKYCITRKAINRDVYIKV